MPYFCSTKYSTKLLKFPSTLSKVFADTFCLAIQRKSQFPWQKHFILLTSPLAFTYFLATFCKYFCRSNLFPATNHRFRDRIDQFSRNQQCWGLLVSFTLFGFPLAVLVPRVEVHSSIHHPQVGGSLSRVRGHARRGAWTEADSAQSIHHPGDYPKPSHPPTHPPSP